MNERVSAEPGFRGAVFHGSVNWLPDDAELPLTSDLDVLVVFDDDRAPARTGKFLHRGVLIEVSSISTNRIQSPQEILGDYRLAGSFRTAGIISDPAGVLTPLQVAVARDYANEHWVRARIQGAQTNALNYLGALDAPAPFYDQVSSWLFGTGVTTHVLLVAGLKNPTVRTRYLAVRDLLEEYRRLDVYDMLLELLGCDEWTSARTIIHLDRLSRAFDAAKGVITSPFFFSADISDLGRPVAIEAARQLIDSGSHREAVFWMVATYARCQKVLSTDGSAAEFQRFNRGFRGLVADLGIVSGDDLRRRSVAVRAELPEIRRVAESILDANLEIGRDSR